MDYSHDFYEKNREGIRKSAKVIVPLVLDLLKPASVVDVGCGPGTWLSVFHESGIEDYLGLDGQWVDVEQLKIPLERFRRTDLSQPVLLDREFDLVVSLEVAEHLPAQAADGFVRSLTGLGRAVLFSAAIPYQGGVHHVNEQWPGYWIERFAANGFEAVDAVRHRIWNDPAVEFCYAQNTFIFARRDFLEGSAALTRERQEAGAHLLPLVHPRKYLDVIDWHASIHTMAKELSAVLGPDGSCIFVDEDNFRPAMAGGRRLLPFLEKDNEYWGAPESDEAAVKELERLRRSGAGFIAFAWPAFWWLDYYKGLHAHLAANARPVLRNERLIVFSLRT